MNWLNLELTTLRSEAYLGSDPIQRATWLNLLAYCADQENGGTIKGCGGWGSRKWLQLLGVTKEEVYTASALWKIEAENIVVWSYPKAKEIEVRAKREKGKRGGRPKKVNDTSGDKPYGSPEVKPDGSNLQKRKGKEGNRKGMEEEVERNDTIKSIGEFFNLNRGSLPKCSALAPSRKASIKARLKEHGEEVIQDVIMKARESDFLQGGSFTCGIDWIFKPANFVKILEGNYENKAPINQKPQQSDAQILKECGL